MMNFVGSTATDVLQQSLELSMDRHRVLADNIANIDTPGYRTRDIDLTRFESELARALRRARRANPNNPQLFARGSDSRTPERLDSSQLVFHDDNNRSIEQLMVEMAKNQSRQSNAAGILRNQINLLRAVISERP